jgi:GNAT superfamily N-acetyltransferase
MVASLKDERTILSVVETRDGRRVGYLWVVFADWYEQHSADINDMYVEEGSRRHGVAMQMLSYVEAETRRRGANLLISGTGVDNEVSQKLHMKYGFGFRRFEYQIWL